MIKQVEIGPGTKPHPDTEVGIDPYHPICAPKQYAEDGYWRWHDYDRETDDVVLPRPIPTGSVEKVYASHVLEHIPAGSPRINTFNEAWRILKPGGTFTFRVPLIGVGADPVQGWQAWADPTHVSYWWFPHSFEYFTGQRGADADYPILLWDEVHNYAPDINDFSEDTPLWAVYDWWEGLCRLRKPKYDHNAISK